MFDDFDYLDEFECASSVKNLKRALEPSTVKKPEDAFEYADPGPVTSKPSSSSSSKKPKSSKSSTKTDAPLDYVQPWQDVPGDFPSLIEEEPREEEEIHPPSYAIAVRSGYVPESPPPYELLRKSSYDRLPASTKRNPVSD